MPVPAQPLATPPPSGALTAPSGPSTGWGAGITTGDTLVDTAITTYAQTGISFDLFGVTTTLKLGGSISFVPLSKTISVTGTLTMTRPAALPSAAGTVTINRGTSPAVYSARFKPGFPVSQMVHDAAAGTPAAGVVDALLVPPLRAFDGGTIIVASDEGYDPDLGDFGKGINFYVSQKVSDLPGISLLPDKWKIDLLHLDQRLLVFAVGVRSPTEYRFSGRAQLDVPLIPGSDFRLTFNEIGLNTIVSPTSSSFGIAHRFTLKLLGESLVFQGGISVEKGSTGEDVVVWGALDPDASPDGMWHRPFGCPGIAIEGLGLQIKLVDRPPFLGIGVRGGVHLGDGLLGASLALNIDPANADDTILVISSPEGLDLPRLIDAVLDVTQLPGLGILSELADVRLKDLELYFAPNGGTIAGKDYDRGISLSATLDLWGYHASLFGRLDVKSGGTLKGEADRIKLDVGALTLVQISDVSGQKGPSVDIALNTSRQGVFYSGRLVLLGGVYDKYQELAITGSGLYFKTGTAMGDLELTCKSSGVDLTISPRFVYSFSVLGLSVRIDIGGVIVNRVDSAGYVQSLSFWFHVCGLDFAVGPVTWGVTLTDLDSVLGVFEHFFGDLVKSFFTDTLGRAFKEAFEWVKDNLTDLAEEAVEIFKSAGAAVADIAKNVFATYEVAVEELIGYLGTGLEEAAAILKGLLSDVTAAAETLGAVFGEAAGAVKAALSSVGYDVANVAGDVWDAIDDAAGYLDPTSW